MCAKDVKFSKQKNKVLNHIKVENTRRITVFSINIVIGISIYVEKSKLIGIYIQILIHFSLAFDSSNRFM